MEHKHLKSLKCPRCGKRMKLLKRRGYIVGCMEYEIFICDRYKIFEDSPNHRILIINYPHESSEKENKIIKL